jgi:hypothetical protein
MKTKTNVDVIKKAESFFINQDKSIKHNLASDMEDKEVLAVSILVPISSSKNLSYWEKLTGSKKNLQKITFEKSDYLSLSIKGLVATIFLNDESVINKISDIDKKYLSLSYHFDRKKRYSIKTHLENIEEIIIDE